MEHMKNGFSEQNQSPKETKEGAVNTPKVLDANIFASLGSPHGFQESKPIGSGNDRFQSTTQFKDTEFSTALEILPGGNKKLSIHFPHVEKGSNRGGAHAGLTFVFDKDIKITNGLVEHFLPYVEKFRAENFTKEGSTYRINTNNPSDIKPINITEPLG